MAITVVVFTLSALLYGPASAMIGAIDTAASVMAPAAEHVVTSTADSGPGTLRQALIDAQNADSISFDPSVFSPASPAFIVLTSGPLPKLTQGNLAINGAAGVALDGSSLTAGSGLTITSDGNNITGIGFINFPDSGITIGEGAKFNTISGSLFGNNGDSGVTINNVGTMSNTVKSSYIGVMPDGLTPMPNGKGISIDVGASHNVIGGGNATPDGGCSGGCNLISGNRGDGVWIGATGTDNNTVAGNYIGVNGAGRGALGNGGFGVLVVSGPHYNLIGGSSPQTRNLISGNSSDGVSIRGSATNNNVVSGNYIGVSVDGKTVLGNGSSGVSLFGGTSYNLVGGDNVSPGGNCTGACNVISGNNRTGLDIESGSHHNTVSGNHIGLSANGASIVANAEIGVHLRDGAHGNVIGGLIPGRRNLISGNGHRGVEIRDIGTTGNAVLGNYIGTDASATVDLGNASDGVAIGWGASQNSIRNNVVSGNDWMGISISDPGTSDNRIAGNRVGVSGTGASGLGNAKHGVLIRAGASGNVIGGSTPADRNVISASQDGPGISLESSGTEHNVVVGNFIGTDASGLLLLGNAHGGISISNQASNNRIGGAVTGEGNLISGNDNSGVRIQDVGTTANTVQGNYIGTQVNGLKELGNAGVGVQIGNGASSNIIGGRNAAPGGPCSGACNLISGNGINGWESGVAIDGQGTMSNTVSGNYIGTNVNGTAILRNLGDGVRLDDGAEFTIIGGTVPGERNLISGNGRDGVEIGGVNRNTVVGNYIGTNAAGSASLGNVERGIGLNEAGVGRAATHNVIQHNLISGNGTNGMDLYGAKSTDNTVTGNLVGTDHSGTLPLGNGSQGILIGGQANGNTLGPNNVIAFNQGGILVIDPGSVNNTITQNSIHSNTYDGIQLVLGGNDEFFAPILTNVGLSSVQGVASPNSVVEIFSDAEDEGRFYQGSTSADGSGNFSYSQQASFTGPSVTATATDKTGNTSEFSGRYTALTDVALEVTFEPRSLGVLNQQVIPSVKVSNRGTSTARDVIVKVEASGSALASAYSASNTIAELNALSYRVLTFPDLTPTKVGSYTFKATVSIPGDQDASNDSLSKNVNVGDSQVDVWTKDNPADIGTVPTTDWWQSPDIWVRNQQDGTTNQIHQSPIAGSENFVYVRVRNRGTAIAENTKVKVYWHEPSLGIACGAWAPIGEVNIDSLPPNETRIVEVSWTPSRTGHTCLFDVLESPNDPVTNECDVAWDNNIEQRNVEIITSTVLYAASDTAVGAVNFVVGNVYGQAKLVDMIVDRSEVAADGGLRLDLGTSLYARWKSVNGGSQLDGATDDGNGVLSITAPVTATIRALPLAAWESLPLTMTLTTAEDSSAQVSIYERIDGNIVGGNTYRTDTYSPPDRTIYLPAIAKEAKN